MNKCEICNSSKNVIKHHVNYFPEEIMYICRSCHIKIHKNISFQIYKPSKQQIIDYYRPQNWNTKRLNFSISKQQIEILKKLAEEENRPYSKQIWHMVEFYIKNKDKV